MRPTASLHRPFERSTSSQKEAYGLEIEKRWIKVNTIQWSLEGLISKNESLCGEYSDFIHDIKVGLFQAVLYREHK